jgi:hypothetical protein
MDYYRYNTAKITGGASLSAETVVPEGCHLVGYITDAAWDTQATTFQICVDGTNYFNLYSEATEYSHAGVTASTFHRVDTQVFIGARKLKIRSGTASVPANQGDDSTVTLVYWKLD